MVKFVSTSKNGKIEWQPNQVTYFSNYLRTLEGKKIVITVKKWSSQRTLPQNAYLHGVVFKTIADHTGNDLQTVKDTCKSMFASSVDEHGFEHRESTSQMSNERMSEFIETICRWAATDWDIYIPPPNE